jgi:hypothetical protein
VAAQVTPQTRPGQARAGTEGKATGRSRDKAGSFTSSFQTRARNSSAQSSVIRIKKERAFYPLDGKQCPLSNRRTEDDRLRDMFR